MWSGFGCTKPRGSCWKKNFLVFTVHISTPAPLFLIKCNFAGATKTPALCKSSSVNWYLSPIGSGLQRRLACTQCIDCMSYAQYWAGVLGQTCLRDVTQTSSGRHVRVELMPVKRHSMGMLQKHFFALKNIQHWRKSANTKATSPSAAWDAQHHKVLATILHNFVVQ